MKTRILVLTLLNVLAASAAASAGEPAQWDERPVQGGVEFRLLNDEGAAIVLRCADQEVHASFVFSEPIEAAKGALVIGQMAGVEPGRIFPPHRRRNFPVAQLNDRTAQIVNGPGLDFTLAMLGAAANMHVRTAGRRASFEVAGSDSMLAQCPGAVGRSPATFGWPRAPGHIGDALGPVPRDMSPSG